MATNPELRQLLGALDDRGLPFGRDDLAWTFESPQPRDDAVRWVGEYLMPPTLLNNEEFDISSTNQNTGIGTSENGRPLTDVDFEAAIASLDSSTVAIDRQCALLESQKQALQQLQSHDHSAGSSVAAEDHQRKNLARETAQLDLDVTELSEMLQQSLTVSTQKADAAVASIERSVARLFDKDDRLLDGLQKLGPKLESAGHDPKTIDEVERLCQILAALQAKDLREKIDAAYHQAHELTSFPATGVHDAIGAREEIAVVKSELEELCSEVDGLLIMVIDHEFRQPFSKGLSRITNQLSVQNARWSEYIVSTMKYITVRLEASYANLQELQAYRSTIQAISTIASEFNAPSSTERKPALELAPSNRRSQKGLKPLVLVNANFVDTQDPTAQLLRSLDLRPGDFTDNGKLSNLLVAAEDDRQKRLALLSASTEHGITKQLSESLLTADREVEHLLGTMYAQSEYGKVRLVDETLEAGLARLEKTTQNLGANMRDLDMESITSAVRSEQAEFVDLWNSR